MMKQLLAMVKYDEEKLENSKEVLDEAKKKEGGNESEILFKSLLKCYSDEELFRPFNDIVTKGQYEKI
jgi:hypothetical protein